MKDEQKEALAQALSKAESALKSGDYPSAYGLFTAIVAQAPGAFPAVMGAGYCAFVLGQLPAAHNYYEQATKLRPRSVQAHHNLGEILLELRIIDRAEEHFRQAIRGDETFVPAHVGLFKAHRFRGAFDAALIEMEKTLKLDPNNVEALSGIVNTRKGEPDEKILSALKRASKSEEQPPVQRASAHFAIGKARNDQKRYDEAFQHFSKGRELQGNQFSRDLHEQYVKDLMEIFSASFMKDREGWGFIGETKPIFVVGVPRSGTSLVEQMLASHPQVHGADELMLLGSVLAQMERAIGNSDLHYPKLAKSMEQPQATLAGKRYCEGLANLSKGKPCVVDKMPTNYFQIGFIKMVMPEAKVIHCDRCLYDTAVSCFSTDFRADHAFLQDLPSLGFYLRQYALLMNHWEKAVPGFVHHVVYEDLVANPEPNLRAMLDFLGLEWDDHCLEFHQQKRNVMTASAWQVRQPLYKSSTRRWKNFEKHLGPLFEELPHEHWRDYAEEHEV